MELTNNLLAVLAIYHSVIIERWDDSGTSLPLPITRAILQAQLSLLLHIIYGKDIPSDVTQACTDPSVSKEVILIALMDALMYLKENHLSSLKKSTDIPVVTLN